MWTCTTSIKVIRSLRRNRLRKYFQASVRRNSCKNNNNIGYSLFTRCLCTVNNVDKTPNTASNKSVSTEKKYASKWNDSIIPGVAGAVGVASLGNLCANQLNSALLTSIGIGGNAALVSGIPVSIVLGMLVGAAVPTTTRKYLDKGLKFCSSNILRTGIIMVGANLSIVEVMQLGLSSIPAVLCSITLGIASVRWMSRRLDIPQKLGNLIAIGTSICGVTAVSALSAAANSSSRDTAIAVATVVALGTSGMLLYPYLAHALFNSSHQVGIFLGLSIHDTSQVLGAAMTYKEVYSDAVALKVATVTKLMRNTCLIGVLPWLAIKTKQHDGNHTMFDNENEKSVVSWKMIKDNIPLFVIGFGMAAALRSVGDITLAENGSAFGLFEENEFNSLVKVIGSYGAKGMLGVAMAAVGLNTQFSTLRGVGWQPFAAGLTGSLVIGVTSCTYVHIFL